MSKTANPQTALCPYRVGDYLYTENTTPPGTSWPGTTWERVTDRFLVGAGGSYSAGATGGEANHTLTKAEVPEFYNVTYGSGGGSNAVISGEAVYTAGNYSGVVQNVPLNNGGGGSHNNMPPYRAVYIYRRTA